VHRLSIVTITYNDHEGLHDTFNSLNLEDIEWIVVDGSTDKLVLERNRQLLAKQNALLIQEPDNGRFHGMNKGLMHANGDLICFLNGGDKFADRNTAAQVLESFKGSQWLWAVGGTVAMNSSGEKLWSWPMPTHNSVKLILGVNSYCHQATFVQTNLLRKIGGFDEDSLYSDWVVSLILSRKVKPHILDLITTHFLVDGISSQQSIAYWKNESIKLRRRHKVCLLGIAFLDSFLQLLAAKFIVSTRGRLIRPDLVEKYP
jgi:glycosyltransferase involved in cell wall biosynthesis